MRVSVLVKLHDAQTFEGDPSSSTLRAPNEAKDPWTTLLDHEAFVQDILSINFLSDLLTMTKWSSNQTASIAAQRTRMERSMQRDRGTGASRGYGEGQLMSWPFRVVAPSGPLSHLDHVYIPTEMPIFSSNRGHIGRFKAAFNCPFCSF